MTPNCPSCNVISEPVYKTTAELPFDYDAGFFCASCNDRMPTDVVLMYLMARIKQLESLSISSKYMYPTL